MRRGIAVTWHSLAFLAAAVLYFIFVLPRWWELLGTWPHGVGTAGRIVTGLVLASAAIPVVLTYVKTSRPEFGVPKLALALRVWSIVGHVAAATLIIGTAIAEIWLDLDSFGRGLFAIYGAAAALALLGATAFHLAYAAELPPPAPKPLKLEHKSASAPAEDAGDGADDSVVADESADVADAADDAEETVADTNAADAPEDAAGTEVADEPADDSADEDSSAPVSKRGLRNRRPSKNADAKN
ncbi:hypothetical protein [Mycolicibacterium confluentis]|uniref:Uncharacterized protein n=1 Tax=Mycolicibacterium confluentis TaxID=28047 RepID=A0A7I7Y585_9MYCO|nr:hypothetical protein [Mycolicibacterium confluentis]MCV7319185.1 hypothetical protein [Mycolicibacterium confluentis]ORV24896.1 hypothetical protein AWB99_05275 [Mycolicibacterium confluentis]BBZ36799.1 hypothetical protein MCNF_54040 [Mycolicibacterium confluentis]